MKDDFIIQRKSDIGLVREKNEDSTLALTHSKNSNIKLLVVADGMGGKDLGDVASKFVTDELKKWFNKVDTDSFNDISKTTDDVKKMILKFNKSLIKKYGSNRLGTTLTMALVLEKETIIFNVGDSRCYLYKDNKLKQVTEDDSQVWLYYKAGEAIKDDLRFFSTSNFICSCVGLSEEYCMTTVTNLNNNDYDLLLLVSDGVSDVLLDEKIESIISRYRRKEILDRIIQEAVYVDQKLQVPMRLRKKFNETFYVPAHGKDNASGAIFIKNI